MAHSKNGSLVYNSFTKCWEDKNGNIGYDHKEVCENCGKPRIDINGVKDCDFCLQLLTECDLVDYACCGHGDPEKAYISFKDGRRWILDTENSRDENAYFFIKNILKEKDDK